MRNILLSLTFFSSKFTQVLSACTCQNGVPDPDPQNLCKSYNSLFAAGTLTDRCIKCNAGFNLSGLKTCIQIRCVCEEGSAFDNLNYVGRSGSGTSGTSGFSHPLESNVVIANLPCAFNKQHLCQNCKRYHHLDVENQKFFDGGLITKELKCSPNICICPGGTPVESEKCDAHNQTQCSVSCNSGYYLAEKICKINKCVCSNGIAVDDIDCSSNGNNQCRGCNNGYYKLGNSCYMKKCVCSNGKPVSYTSCTANGANQCSSCNPYYDKITDGSCYLTYGLRTAPHYHTNTCGQHQTVYRSWRKLTFFYSTSGGSYHNKRVDSCYWVFTGPKYKKIEMHVSSAGAEPGYDYFQFFEGSSTSNYLSNCYSKYYCRYSANKMSEQNLISRSNIVTIGYHSDGSAVRSKSLVVYYRYV